MPMMMNSRNIFATDVGSTAAYPSVPWMTGAIGTSFFTPEQHDFRSFRKLYGGPDDPDAGSYCLDRVHWNKEDGTLSVANTDASPIGWRSTGAPDNPSGCDCGGSSVGGCTC